MAVARKWFGGWQVRVRYFAQSLAGLIVGLALLTAWVEVVGLRPELAVLINWLLLGIVNCLILDRWVFAGPAASTVRDFAHRFVGYQAAMLTSKGLNYAVFVALIWAGVIYQLAWVAGAGLSFGLSLALNRRWFDR